jgi:hypothetical protein
LRKPSRLVASRKLSAEEKSLLSGGVRKIGGEVTYLSKENPAATNARKSSDAARSTRLICSMAFIR